MLTRIALALIISSLVAGPALADLDAAELQNLAREDIREAAEALGETSAPPPDERGLFRRRKRG